jgi:outer membrane receptor protein involved in Fe transport
MKKILVSLSLLLVAAGANAQWFDFSNNNGRYETGLNIGKAGYTTPYEGLTLGFNIVAWGVSLNVIKEGPQHRYDDTVDNTQWNDHVALNIDLGYQIPVLKWLRIMPVAGYCQTNEGITDASKLYADSDESGISLYHPYKVTRGSREHYFNYGAGISIQPIKWISLTATYSRYAFYAGVNLDIAAFAAR